MQSQVQKHAAHGKGQSKQTLAGMFPLPRPSSRKPSGSDWGARPPHPCRSVRHPRCEHSCACPRGRQGSQQATPRFLHTPHHPARWGRNPSQSGLLRGPEAAPPRSPVPGRPQLRPGDPRRHRTRYPSGPRATLPAGRHTCWDRPPGAARGTLCGERWESKSRQVREPRPVPCNLSPLPVLESSQIGGHGLHRGHQGSCRHRGVQFHRTTP